LTYVTRCAAQWRGGDARGAVVTHVVRAVDTLQIPNVVVLIIVVIIAIIAIIAVIFTAGVAAGFIGGAGP
jgi:Flp pilus assembly protein protease CpaA